MTSACTGRPSAALRLKSGFSGSSRGSIVNCVQCEGTICCFASSPGDCHSDAPTAAGNHQDGLSTDAAIRARHLLFRVHGLTSKRTGRDTHDSCNDARRRRSELAADCRGAAIGVQGTTGDAAGDGLQPCPNMATLRHARERPCRHQTGVPRRSRAANVHRARRSSATLCRMGRALSRQNPVRAAMRLPAIRAPAPSARGRPSGLPR